MPGPARPRLAASDARGAQVFCNTGESWSEEMRQACFDYLRLGGVYAQGPISLLSGLNPRPFVLVAHFFMVALYGVRLGRTASKRACPDAIALRGAQIGRLLLPVPTPKGIYMGARLLLGASAIILPIIRAEVCALVLTGSANRCLALTSHPAARAFARCSFRRWCRATARSARENARGCSS